MNSLLKLFLTFFQIGLFSIGGGYAIIPLIQEQVVNIQKWISPKTFTDIITISQMTPGPLAVNTSTFVGLQIAGVPGAVLATLGCVISGICISVFLHRFFVKHGESVYVLEVLKGLKAASLGLIVSAAVTLLLLAFAGTSELNAITSIDWFAVTLFAASFVALRKFKVNPILLTVITGVIGGLVYGFLFSFL